VSRRAGWKRSMERVKKCEERSWRRTRRISPLQRILSALHLFQDAVFSLCVEKNPTPSSLENVCPFLFLSFPFCPVSTSSPARLRYFCHRSSGDVLRFHSAPSATSRRERTAIYLCDSKIVNREICLITIEFAYIIYCELCICEWIIIVK